MDRRQMIVRAGAATLGLQLAPFRGAFPSAWAADAASPKRRVLFFTKSSEYQHSVVARTGDELSHAEKIVTHLGDQHGFDVTCTKDGRVFTPENIASYDVFFFYTQGDPTKSGVDKQPPMSKEGKAAFLVAIREGKGFVGSHCASDTFHSPGVDRFDLAGDKMDPYIAMLGGEFISHGAQQNAEMIVSDHKFPGCEKLANRFALIEEWYSLKDFSDDLHVLLLQETAGMVGELYQRPIYPATWARMYGKGRVFYTSMGHFEQVWDDKIFQSVLLGGIAWALGNVQADITPNIETVAPKVLS
jgi:type 1 glutamine amidotransferase